MRNSNSPEGAYGPQTVRMMGEAYERACAEAKEATGLPPSPEEEASIADSLRAGIDRGVRDLRALTDAALRATGLRGKGR